MFAEIWTETGWLKQSLWALAVVTTLLLFIRLGLSLYGEEEAEKKRFDVRLLLTFSAVFSWVAILALNLGTSTASALMYGGATGVLSLLIFGLFSWVGNTGLNNAGSLTTDNLKTHTGRVLQPIPPHRNGFGKVHLDLRGVPYSIDAITAGQSLKVGASIRVVEVLDDQVLLVEPAADTLKPGAPKGDKITRG